MKKYVPSIVLLAALLLALVSCINGGQISGGTGGTEAAASGGTLGVSSFSNTTTRTEQTTKVTTAMSVLPPVTGDPYWTGGADENHTPRY